MKHLLLTTIAAVVLVGCGNPEADRALLDAVKVVPGNVEDVKLHLADGADVNAKDKTSWTPLHFLTTKAVAELLITKGCALHCLWPSHFVLAIYLVHSYALPSFHSHE